MSNDNESSFMGMEDTEARKATKAFDDEPVKTPSFSAGGSAGDDPSGSGADDDAGATGTGGGASTGGGSTGSGGGASQGGGTGN